jgi:hypothetical protein
MECLNLRPAYMVKINNCKLLTQLNNTSHRSPPIDGGHPMAKSVTEAQLRIPALQLLAKSKTGFMRTSKLIDELAEIFKPEGKDATIIPRRSDTYFSQKVRNMVSHRGSSVSLQRRGFAIYHKDREGMEITDTGRAFLKQKGLL